MWKAMQHLNIQQIIQSTLLGNAGMEDRKIIGSVINEVFGLQVDIEEDPTLGGDLF